MSLTAMGSRSAGSGMEAKGAAAEFFTAVPAGTREQIVSGLRWTAWLSLLSAPLGFGTSILLARVSPEAIGTYGVLLMYVDLIAVFFYLGGNAVAIRFLPSLGPEERLSFLASYFLLISGVATLWLGAAALWPDKLRYLFGQSTGAPFQWLLLSAWPVLILFSLVPAALKGMMELRCAQALSRTVTIGSFAVYGLLFVAAPGFLTAHYGRLIWAVYLSLAGIASAIGLRVLLRLNDWRGPARRLRFFLPPGFWRYTLGLQAGSILGFVSTRLDYLFLLNAGGLAVLGQYVALITLVSVIPILIGFLLDSLLPALTRTLADPDTRCSRQVTETYLRLIFPVALGMGCFLLFFAEPLVRLLGPRYRHLGLLIQFAAPFAALQAINGLTGTILSATGRSQADATIKAIRIVVFVSCFWPLWSRAGLLGAVQAWALGELTYQCLSLFLVCRKKVFPFSLFNTYAPFALVLAAATAAAWKMRQVWVASAGLWLVFLLAFLVLAGYTGREVRRLGRLILPAP